MSIRVSLSYPFSTALKSALLQRLLLPRLAKPVSLTELYAITLPVIPHFQLYDKMLGERMLRFLHPRLQITISVYLCVCLFFIPLPP